MYSIFFQLIHFYRTWKNYHNWRTMQYWVVMKIHTNTVKRTSSTNHGTVQNLHKWKMLNIQYHSLISIKMVGVICTICFIIISACYLFFFFLKKKLLNFSAVEFKRNPIFYFAINDRTLLFLGNRKEIYTFCG